jgi:hypothetical protein
MNDAADLLLKTHEDADFSLAEALAGGDTLGLVFFRGYW